MMAGNKHPPCLRHGFQIEPFAKPATDGASAACRHFANPQNPTEHAIWRRAVAAPF
jgi:hypothetical protein